MKSRKIHNIYPNSDSCEISLLSSDQGYDALLDLESRQRRILEVKKMRMKRIMVEPFINPSLMTLVLLHSKLISLVMMMYPPHHLYADQLGASRCPFRQWKAGKQKIQF
eukprot:7446446-Ditylum_brightwellii.AAC.1